MLFIFRGRGWLVPVLWFALLVAAEFATELVARDSRYYQAHLWPAAIVHVLEAPLLVLVWRRLHPDATASTVFSLRSLGMPRTKDSFIFMPVHWWVRILPLIALAVVCVGLINGSL